MSGSVLNAKQQLDQYSTGTCKFGAIDSLEILRKNLQENCSPETIGDYE